MEKTRDLRVTSLRPLLSPAILLDEHPVTEVVAKTVDSSRRAVSKVLHGQDDRFIVIVGPCSIHDIKAAHEYATKLKGLATELEKELVVVMRVYFEKPRTTVGWKGLINDPNLNDSYDINEGLRIARKLLLDLNSEGVACATEFLDPITPQFISDLVAWGAIGARTTESQTHRELASGLSMPIGFKNGTMGTVQIAVDAASAATHSHRFLGVTEQGLAAIVTTAGNPDSHVILRGGNNGPNFEAEHVAATAEAMKKSGIVAAVIVDCSHGNSNKDYKRQPAVVANLAEQIAAGQTALCGAMIESHLVEGRQNLGKDPSALTYGQSITDACIGWESTEESLRMLAEAVRRRRAR